MNKNKIKNVGLIICVIGILITTIYLIPKLYGVEKLMWALWGLFIFVGTNISIKTEEDKNKREVK